MVGFSYTQSIFALLAFACAPQLLLAKPIALSPSLSRRVGSSGGIEALDYVGGPTGNKVGEAVAAKICIYDEPDPSSNGCSSTPLYCSTEPLAYGLAYAFPNYDVTSQATDEDQFRTFTAVSVEWDGEESFDVELGYTVNDSSSLIQRPGQQMKSLTETGPVCTFAKNDSPGPQAGLQTVRLVYNLDS